MLDFITWTANPNLAKIHIIAAENHCKKHHAAITWFQLNGECCMHRIICLFLRIESMIKKQLQLGEDNKADIPAVARRCHCRLDSRNKRPRSVGARIPPWRTTARLPCAEQWATCVYCAGKH